MNDYDPTNEYEVLIRIFRFIRDYSTSTYTLSSVVKKLINYLNTNGDEAEVTYRCNSFRVLTVNGHQYKIVKYPEWSKYDVQLLA